MLRQQATACIVLQYKFSRMLALIDLSEPLDAAESAVEAAVACGSGLVSSAKFSAINGAALYGSNSYSFDMATGMCCVSTF